MTLHKNIQKTMSYLINTCLFIIFLFLTTSNAQELERKEFVCRRTTEKIIIDGILDEEAWKDSNIIDTFYTPKENLPPQSPTKVYMLYDDNYLYIAAKLKDKDIYAFKTEHNSRTWEDDVFEIFIKPSEEKYQYYEFHVTPRNINLELMIPRRGSGSMERFFFESGMKSAVQIKGTLNNWRDVDDYWTVEVKIPFSAFKDTVPIPPKAGDRWTFAICRYDYSVHLPLEFFWAVELSSSARLSQVNFHLYEDYDILVF
jgi:hypothetical protein